MVYFRGVLVDFFEDVDCGRSRIEDNFCFGLKNDVLLFPIGSYSILYKSFGYVFLGSSLFPKSTIRGENLILRRNLHIKAIPFRNCFNKSEGLFKAKSNYINLSTKINQPKALNRRFFI